MSTIPSIDPAVPPLGKRGAFEGVARRHGRRRNPARMTPRSSLRTPTNPALHIPQRWVEKADRSIKGSDTPQQLAALGRVPLGALQAHAHHVELGLGELALDPQDELVVEIPEVVDPVGVDHERVGQPAVLKQPLGLGARARQPRDLKAEDRADLP